MLQSLHISYKLNGENTFYLKKSLCILGGNEIATWVQKLVSESTKIETHQTEMRESLCLGGTHTQAWGPRWIWSFQTQKTPSCIVFPACTSVMLMDRLSPLAPMLWARPGGLFCQLWPAWAWGGQGLSASLQDPHRGSLAHLGLTAAPADSLPLGPVRPNTGEFRLMGSASLRWRGKRLFCFCFCFFKKRKRMKKESEQRLAWCPLRDSEIAQSIE